MDLEELQEHWNRFGHDDPLWAVLTVPQARNNGWDPDEFFRTGVDEVRTVLDWIDEQAVQDGGKLGRQRALDFGCGVGRLTQALAEHFDQCDGVDIAPSMLAEAERRNRYGARCRYHLNDRADLSLFETGSYDLVYTAHVLQHMEPRFSKAFIAEFVRLLKPGGYALLELVTELVEGATEALPDDAFVARIELLSAIPQLVPGSRFRLPVRVTNRSPRTWPAAGHEGWFLVTLGNHWLDATRSAVVFDDARTCLPHDVEPGGVVDTALTITAPTAGGTYRLQVDLVQEGVAWFATRGSPPAETSVVVGDATAESGRHRLLRALRTSTQRARSRLKARSGRPPAEADGIDDGTPGPPEPEPIMEMHGIGEDELATVVAAAGGRIVAGLDWERISGSVDYDWHRRGFLITPDPRPAVDPTLAE